MAILLQIFTVTNIPMRNYYLRTYSRDTVESGYITWPA